MFTSQHEILATGCIQALPKASNLFRGVAFGVAFHFILDVAFCFFRSKVFFDIVEDAAVFEVVCFGSACTEVARAEAVAVSELFFPRALLLRTRVTGASFTGSATASELPGVTMFDDK